MPRGKKRPQLLAQASAYYRNAAKAERAGRYQDARRFRDIADRKVRQHRRNIAYIRRTA